MPTISRKRPAPSTEEPPSEAPTPQPPNRARRRQSSSSTSAEDDDSPEEGSSHISHQNMVKNLVRLALSSEHTRTPIKRADMSRVLETGRREFKSVFDSAQLALRSTFGMEMVELPAREKVTLKEKRAAQKSQTQSGTSKSSSKQWVLCSILPAEYRDEDVLGPARAPTSDKESTYIGLYTFIVSVIALAGGQIARSKLDRILRRMNANDNTPIDTTDNVIKRMVKQDYINQIKEQQGGEEIEDLVIGPRGRVEIGSDGVAGLVRRVYGHSDDGGAAEEELEQRLERSLKVVNMDREPPQTNASISAANGAAGNSSGKRGRPRRSQRQDSDDDD